MQHEVHYFIHYPLSYQSAQLFYSSILEKESVKSYGKNPKLLKGNVSSYYIGSTVLKMLMMLFKK